MTWTLRPGALAAFRERLHGRLVCPDDSSYDAARRVWNGRIDRRPAIIALCSDTMDVVAAVHFAHEHELVAAVRGGSPQWQIEALRRLEIPEDAQERVHTSCE